MFFLVLVLWDEFYCCLSVFHLEPAVLPSAAVTKAATSVAAPPPTRSLVSEGPRAAARSMIRRSRRGLKVGSSSSGTRSSLSVMSSSPPGQLALVTSRSQPPASLQRALASRQRVSSGRSSKPSLGYISTPLRKRPSGGRRPAATSPLPRRAEPYVTKPTELPVAPGNVSSPASKLLHRPLASKETPTTTRDSKTHPGSHASVSSQESSPWQHKGESLLSPLNHRKNKPVGQLWSLLSISWADPPEDSSGSETFTYDLEDLVEEGGDFNPYEFEAASSLEEPPIGLKPNLSMTNQEPQNNVSLGVGRVERLMGLLVVRPMPPKLPTTSSAFIRRRDVIQGDTHISISSYTTAVNHSPVTPLSFPPSSSSVQPLHDTFLSSPPFAQIQPSSGAATPPLRFSSASPSSSIQREFEAQTPLLSLPIYSVDPSPPQMLIVDSPPPVEDLLPSIEVSEGFRNHFLHSVDSPSGPFVHVYGRFFSQINPTRSGFPQKDLSVVLWPSSVTASPLVVQVSFQADQTGSSEALPGKLHQEQKDDVHRKTDLNSFSLSTSSTSLSACNTCCYGDLSLTETLPAVSITDRKMDEGCQSTTPVLSFTRELQMQHSRLLPGGHGNASNLPTPSSLQVLLDLETSQFSPSAIYSTISATTLPHSDAETHLSSPTGQAVHSSPDGRFQISTRPPTQLISGAAKPVSPSVQPPEDRLESTDAQLPASAEDGSVQVLMHLSSNEGPSPETESKPFGLHTSSSSVEAHSEGSVSGFEEFPDPKNDSANIKDQVLEPKSAAKEASEGGVAVSLDGLASVVVDLSIPGANTNLNRDVSPPTPRPVVEAPTATKISSPAALRPSLTIPSCRCKWHFHSPCLCGPPPVGSRSHTNADCRRRRSQNALV